MIGHIDGFESGRIVGWVYDLMDPRKAQQIKVFAGDGEIAAGAVHIGAGLKAVDHASGYSTHIEIPMQRNAKGQGYRRV